MQTYDINLKHKIPKLKHKLRKLEIKIRKPKYANIPKLKPKLRKLKSIYENKKLKSTENSNTQTDARNRNFKTENWKLKIRTGCSRILRMTSASGINMFDVLGSKLTLQLRSFDVTASLADTYRRFRTHPRTDASSLRSIHDR